MYEDMMIVEWPEILNRLLLYMDTANNIVVLSTVDTIVLWRQCFPYYKFLSITKYMLSNLKLSYLRIKE